MIAPYTAAEVAALIGLSVDRFRKTRSRLHARDGLPQPISSSGHPRWERAGIDAWLTRNHPHRPPRPANDLAAPLVPASTPEWGDFLRKHYAPARDGT